MNTTWEAGKVNRVSTDLVGKKYYHWHWKKYRVDEKNGRGKRGGWRDGNSSGGGNCARWRNKSSGRRRGLSGRKKMGCSRVKGNAGRGL